MKAAILTLFVSGYMAAAPAAAQDACSNGVISIDLGIIETQQKSNWCWAAVTNMVRKSVIPGAEFIEQCEIVAEHVRLSLNSSEWASTSPMSSDCCASEKHRADLCNMPQYPRFEDVNVRATSTETALSIEALKAELYDFSKANCAGRPVAFVWEWAHNRIENTNKRTGGGKHIMLAAGHALGLDHADYFFVIDPNRGAKDRNTGNPIPQRGVTSEFDVNEAVRSTRLAERSVMKYDYYLESEKRHTHSKTYHDFAPTAGPAPARAGKS